jgi:hypothetical protein
LADRLRSLLRWSPYEDDDFEKAKKLPGLTSQSTATALLEGIVAQRGAWRPAQYLTVAQAIAESLAIDERNRFALWVVQALADELPTPVAAIHPPAISHDLDSALAGFLVAVWGFRDKRERGAAVHVALGLVARRGAGLVARLVEELEERHAPAFRSRRLPPLSQSSRLWLLFALAHVGTANPSLLEPHADRLARLALSREYPHAQGRELAKRAALFAEASRPGLLPADVVDRLRRLNQPISTSPVAGVPRRENPRRRDKSLRFSFDEMDVLPYWYEPLADVFDVSTTDVARRADRWIVDEWRYTDDDWWHDVRELRERDSRETMADHGSYPRYEILRTYLEFHAMQMAAGELIDTHPVAAPRWTEDDDRWGDWLARWMDTDPNSLIADLRSPTPLVAPFYGRIESAADRRLSDDYFDQFVGFSERSPSSIVVGGTASVARPDEHQSVTIASALVVPEKGMALVSALETADEPISWALPVTGSGAWANDEILHPSYKLEAWLEIEKRNARSLEEHDPLAEGVEYEIWRPLLIDGASAVPASVLVRDTDTAPAWLEIWSDPTDNDNVVHGEGVRLWVRLEPLREMLRRRDRALILSITIHGYRPGRPGREDRLVPDQTHLYLLCADGRLRTLGGDRFLGPTDRERAQSGGEG